MLSKKIFFIFFFLSFAGFKGFAQTNNDSTGNNAKQLKDYQQQATELYNAFKNGPAFDLLLQYGELKEKEQSKQGDNDLIKLESKFKIDYSRRQQELKDIQESVDLLKKENESLEKEKQKLTRNTVLFFVILVSLLIGILISRVKLAKKAQDLSGISSVQLNRTLKLTEISNGINKIMADLKFGFDSVFEAASKSLSLNAKLKTIAANQKKKIEDIQKMDELLRRVQADVGQAASSLASTGFLMGEVAEEKVITNLNVLINEVFDISFHWIKSFDESFDCNKVKDLEKILPEISIMPVAIRTALFHFLNNAFYSVYEKKKTAGKSYEPKVSVSSRKLPRFLQIRIKDNGSGIEDKIISQIYAPFFTNKPPDKASGLGLTLAAEIIKKKHGGEIIIESEPGKGADFIIRFPINTLM